METFSTMEKTMPLCTYNALEKDITEHPYGGILYDAESLEHLSVPARIRLAELHTQHEDWDYVTCEAVLIEEGLFNPEPPAPAMHTPGPWIFNKHGAVYGPNEPTPRGQAYQKLIRAAIQTEAQAARYGGTLAEQTANGHLIAAAPEMLEALRRCMLLIRRNVDMSHPHDVKFMAEVQNIIAKATGPDSRTNF